MKVCVLGSGGREHAIAWKLFKEGHEIIAVPGNPGIKELGETHEIHWFSEDFLSFLKSREVDFVIVGPEQPLALGIKDFIEKETGIPVFGVDKESSKLEASKIFARNFMKKYGIPIPRFEVIYDYQLAVKSLKSFQKFPIVIKADGLAGGKGVTIVNNEPELLSTLLEYMLKGKFGESSQRVVIEEFLEGFEASVFVLIDRYKNWLWLGDALDYKKLYDHDKGPNTGGMGSVSPHPFLTDELKDKIKEEVIERTIKGLTKENIHYVGILYIGLMISKKTPYVLEFNVRLGDPETQAIFPIIDEAICDIFYEVVKGGRILDREIKTTGQKSVCVVLASKGYPFQIETGKLITGLDEPEEGVIIFHAGTTMKEDKKIYTSSGRVLNVVGLDNDFPSARKKAYDFTHKIQFEGKYCRTDIGLII